MLLLLNLCILFQFQIQSRSANEVCFFFAIICFSPVRHAAFHAERMRTVSWYMNL
jgi:hypothetical protein